jgi:hypothetical protein
MPWTNGALEQLGKIPTFRFFPSNNSGGSLGKYDGSNSEMVRLYPIYTQSQKSIIDWIYIYRTVNISYSFDFNTLFLGQLTGSGSFVCELTKDSGGDFTPNDNYGGLDRLVPTFRIYARTPFFNLTSDSGDYPYSIRLQMFAESVSSPSSPIRFPFLEDNSKNMYVKLEYSVVGGVTDAITRIRNFNLAGGPTDYQPNGSLSVEGFTSSAGLYTVGNSQPAGSNSITVTLGSTF